MFEWQLREAGPALPGWPVLGAHWGALSARPSGRQCTRDRPNLKSASLQVSALGQAHACVHRHPPE